MPALVSDYTWCFVGGGVVGHPSIDRGIRYSVLSVLARLVVVVCALFVSRCSGLSYSSYATLLFRDPSYSLYPWVRAHAIPCLLTYKYKYAPFLRKLNPEHWSSASRLVVPQSKPLVSGMRLCRSRPPSSSHGYLSLIPRRFLRGPSTCLT